ncbi:MAG TPA: Plug domain-containing protein [Phenylobacterium sp.]|nr:Plug domain-containing protein [Phenylobacterium sp.]
MPFFLRIAGRALASCATAALLAAQPAWADADAAGSLADLSRLSLEELANVEITSVSKRPEALSGAPAAVYVISNDEIRLSGADSLPEALRLAPNLQVARMNASGYGVSARGFNHSTGTSNKLQVLIDGRSIYTPLYSGVFWDAQGVMLDDVERIEVISGPGERFGAPTPSMASSMSSPARPPTPRAVLRT